MKSPTKINDAVHLIEGEVGGRPLHLPLIQGSERILLVDTGCASDVANTILPGLDSLGLQVTDLTDIIITHCDVDHQGGNHAMKQAAPSAKLACGRADVSAVSDPEVILARRYEAYRAHHGHHYDEATLKWLRDELGEAQAMDGSYDGGETISLGGEDSLEVLHLPGHSRGHLGLWDSRRKMLVAGDAVHGKVYEDTMGQPALCPTYLHVQPYLKTIARIEALKPEIYIGCHWPVMTSADAVLEFCAESREFVERAEELILKAIQNSGSGGIGLSELCQNLGPELGEWPRPVDHELCYAFNGHLEDLSERGTIERIEGALPYRYIAKP